MHKSQILILLALAYGAGVALGTQGIIQEQQLVWIIGVAAAVMGISAYYRTFGDSTAGIRKRKVGILAGVMLLCVAGGVWRFHYVNAEYSVMSQFADRQAGTRDVTVTMRGYIDGDPDTADARFSVPFRVKEIVAPPRIIFVDERVLLVAEKEPGIGYGTFLSVQGTPKTPTSFSEFDYAAYLRKDGIRYVLNNPKVEFVNNLSRVTWRDRMRRAVMEPIFSIRNSFMLSVRQSVPEPAASYLVGILLGVRSQLSDSLKDAFNRTGTSHILAISGYNIAVVAQTIMAALVVVLYRRRAFWAAVATIGVFVVMTGASASVIRAAIMGILVLAASSYGRLYYGSAAIVCAAALMLILNPLLLKSDIGFQLSFVATLGIMLLYEPLENWLRRRKVGDGLRSVVATTTAAQIAVFPLLMFHFGTISLVALPVNILVLPMVPPAMLAGFITGVLGMLWSFAGRVVGIVAWAISNYQLIVVQEFAKVPFAAVDIHVTLIAVAAFYGVLCWYLIQRRYAR